MTDDVSNPAKQASRLQEAIDTIAQTFDHPGSLSIDYTNSEGVKRSTIEVETPDGSLTYELRFAAQDDNTEPQLHRVE